LKVQIKLLYRSELCLNTKSSRKSNEKS